MFADSVIGHLLGFLPGRKAVDHPVMGSGGDQIAESNVDDLGDYRPGLQAKNEQGVRSVLQEAGFRKEEIRQLSKELGLSN